MAKTVKMNNVDVTSYFVPEGMRVTYKKILGRNGGTYLSGDREEDVLAWKAVVKIPCMPLTETQQADFLSKATADHPMLYYYDPRANAYRTIHYMSEVSEGKFRGKGGTGVDYWTGYMLTAEETCEYKIVQQPADLTVEAGTTAVFTIAVSGENLTYQWQYRTSSSGTWTNSNGSGNKTDTLSFSATAARNGYQYRCNVSNGFLTLTSDAATLTVETTT